MSNANDVDNNLSGVNFIEETVFAEPNPVRVGAPAQPGSSCWARVVGQNRNRLLHTFLDLLRKRANLTDGLLV
ncbi:MAG: hypothetical protein A2289_17650 [Deltaproteobacteria bacterium RIFOXYA12_FULL_58_15]|nr:MAG: hypothetical protein A2289_17650 [Deltaproteobacteria bacterium RIFOXYA12_FULL_58_15]OGR12762.1 MAG: hypothetical protein A2341_21755 [Deltaproteobacteria bacterium RIFOXYB12_FULL_58_9]